MYAALLSILSPDRVGLISAITGHLFNAGINLRDTTFAVMGQGAEFTAVCEVPDDLATETLQAELARLPELADGQIRVLPYVFDTAPGPAGRITHRVVLSGGDQPGLVARLSDIFTQFGANIVRLDAQTVPDAAGGRYITRFAVWIPPERAEICLSAIANTAGTLGLACEAEPA
jgi:glycine cleavage system transcriptional repressor